MKKRAEIKRQSQQALGGQYGKAVVMVLIVSIIPFLMAWISVILGVNFLLRLWIFFRIDLLRTISVTISSIALFVFLILAQPVLHVGNSRFFLSLCSGGDAGLIEAFAGFKRFGQALGGMLWMILWIFLWSLLFVVPGIIKCYSYFATPYILADCPKVYGPDAVELSKRIMKGNKAKIFVTQLTFLGWFLLSLLTLGILWVFYVGPYYNVVMAEYYREIREDAIARGVVTQEEFEGGEISPLPA